MAGAIVTLVAGRIAALLEEQVREKINLVRGVEEELRSLSDELKTIGYVLDDAERRRFKEKSVKDWLKKLEDTSYEMDDVLDEWNYSIIKLQRKVRPFIPFSLLYFKKIAIRHDIALKVKEVKTRLDLILAEKDRYGFLTSASQSVDPTHESWRVQSTSLINLEEVCGRDLERENLVIALIAGGGWGEGSSICVLSIVGVGGLGKTTLAKLAYNDSRVEEYFDLRIWIYVSDPFDEVGIAKGILESAGGPLPFNNHLDILLFCLRNSISRKKFLLVMDDVWTHDRNKWEPLKNCLRHGRVGSKILVTTRNERVAIMMGSSKNEIHNLGHLSHRDCWLLLGRRALCGKNKEECEKFQDIGKKIANKCKGLPLAANVGIVD